MKHHKPSIGSRLGKVVGWMLGILFGFILLSLLTAVTVYPSQYVYRVLAWRESDAFDWQKFPAHNMDAAPTPFYFDDAPDAHVADLFMELADTDDWDAFLTAQQTQAFIVVQDGTVVYEQYFNDTQRDAIVTSFSMAKSFTSALIGIAIDEGYINSVDDPIPDYLPELAERDPNFNKITIRHLLLMSSGLAYQEMRWGLLNGDAPLTTYYPDQRQIALENTHIIDSPETYFRYNKYHPQLLGMILERTTGATVTDYLQTKIWNPIGMEYGGSWSTDSETSNFEKMETGVNARAIDFAKFGQLFLNDGEWHGTQVISDAWVAESTAPFLPADYDSYYSSYFTKLPGQGYYTYMWWGMMRDNGSYDFVAEGDKGQFIFVSPHKKLVIVRHGIEYGIPDEQWLDLFYSFSTAL